MTELLNDPMVALALFLVSAMIAIGSLLSAMKRGGSTFGVLVALIFAGLAAYLVPTVIELMNSSASN